MDVQFLKFRKLGVYQSYIGPQVSGHSHAPSMGDNMAYTSGPLSAFNTKVIIVTACLLLVLIFALLVNLFSRWFLRRLLSSPSLDTDSTCKAHSGLKKDHLESLPTTTYLNENAHLSHTNVDLPQDVVSSLSQCPICLVDFRDGERIRVLPKCQHGFHIPCIDMWLSKNSSCPTCRGDLMDNIS